VAAGDYLLTEERVLPGKIADILVEAGHSISPP
jgi:hypothetical protein